MTTNNKNKIFPIGSKVAAISRSYKDDLQIGTVIGYWQNLTIVEWDNGKIIKLNNNSLVSAQEAQQKKSQFEEEFQAYQDELNDKINQATKLIKEANQLARKNGLDLSHFDLSNISEKLIDAIEECGWNTSSWQC
jgi:hypothetical protein